MNPLSDRPFNPIVNARIIGSGISTERYLSQEPGVKRGDPDYCMGRSDLMAVLRCPHKWLEGIKDDDTKYSEWGTLLDLLLLSPDQVDDRIAVCPETYPDSKTGEPKPWNFNANFCKEWREKAGNRLIVKAAVFSEAKEAVKRMAEHSEIRNLIACSKTQVLVMGEYHDKETGIVVPLKSLNDLVPDKEHPKFGKVLADLKTSVSAAERAWRKKVHDSDYDAQAALHHDLYVAATGEERTDFWHPVQESAPPYETVLHKLSKEFVYDVGQEKYLAALRIYCACLKLGKWPSYPPPQPYGYLEPEPWMTEVRHPRPEDFGLVRDKPAKEQPTTDENERVTP